MPQRRFLIFTSYSGSTTLHCLQVHKKHQISECPGDKWFGTYTIQEKDSESAKDLVKSYCIYQQKSEEYMYECLLMMIVKYDGT